MRTGICADIHCNWEAYSAVAEHRAWRRADRRFFLGDLIGYGPEPERCWSLLETRAFDVVTIGNMEDAIETGPQALLADMTESKRAHTESPVIYLHGSPRDPIYEYLRLQSLTSQPERDRFRETFDILKRRRLTLCFSAHTHRPGVVTETLKTVFPPQLKTRKTRVGDARVYKLTDDTTIINVGSVGQSRDSDWRAGFVVFDDNARRVEFYRAEYPVEKTVEKILTIEDLPRDLRLAYAEMIARDKAKVSRIAASLVPDGEKSEDQLAREWMEEIERQRSDDHGPA